MIHLDNIGAHILQRLEEYNVRHIFGVAGDYILNFFKMIEDSNIKLICTCDEQSAGFAADAYARINGIGVVCVTYGVGGFKVVNSTAQAYAERSPLMIISGAPRVKERSYQLHHTIKGFDTQFNVFKNITISSVILDDPKKAIVEFDDALLSCINYKRPVYVELPRDMVYAPIGDYHRIERRYVSNENALREALQEIKCMMDMAKRPVIIAGEEIQRFKLESKLKELVEKINIPVASTILSKSVINEYHPLYLGVYEGAIGHEDVREYVESSDCIIIIGALLSDITLGIFTAKLDQNKCINITSEGLSIRYHKYENIRLDDFIDGLIKILDRKEYSLVQKGPIEEFVAKKKKITINRLFKCINYLLKYNHALVVDAGDALFGSADLIIQKGTIFMSCAYYSSLGFAIPASLGIQLANPTLRPIVLVGDGSFQMTGMEVSTIARYNLNPIIIILNNKGYTTERIMIDGPFNDLNEWRYELIPNIINSGKGFIVNTEEEFYNAILDAEAYDGLSIINVVLDKDDKSEALKRMAEHLAKKVRDTKDIL